MPKSTTHPLNPVVAIELDQPRTMACDFFAIESIDRDTGKNLMAGDNILDCLTQPRQLATVIRHLLAHEDEALTVDQVMRWLSPGSLPYVLQCVHALLRAYFPVPSEDAAQEAEPLPLPNGPQ